MANNGYCPHTWSSGMNSQQQLPCCAATDAGGMATHESTCTGSGWSHKEKIGQFKCHSRISNPTDIPLTILADSSLKMSWQVICIFGMRYIHCLTLEFLDSFPAERHQRALVLKLVMQCEDDKRWEEVQFEWWFSWKASNIVHISPFEGSKRICSGHECSNDSGNKFTDEDMQKVTLFCQICIVKFSNRICFSRFYLELEKFGFDFKAF